MQKGQKELLITREDHNLITKCINAFKKIKSIDGRTISLLWEQFRNAIIVEKKRFPKDVARLNSTVIVKNIETNLAMAYTIVLPDEVDRRKNKVSILSPIGIALIGLKKGLYFSWERLARKKNFSVLEVYHSPSLERAERRT
ncbi:GreA/GreB family elongation factor [Flavitalea sp. BT771]|uniref:GreA/GreB family elongation factor n=1 Tax=Flavitalea sp. BT771 TaxID=3063329 RepID=UPI0026E3E437|nr:GreA/GreB family elongation factor [Flavitalea sp. BT771]MDO6435449.1 GreA/GreB family elongation factor [Flavitalea sp. BT771]MDV6224191.1 GreA/GreB family elongation factor [Flavitalea sp. BT771]